MGTMTYNNISTIDMGVVIQTPPVYTFSNKNYETIEIAGRNGSLLIDNETYANIVKTYYLAMIFRPSTQFVSNAAALIDWLTSSKGYARLEDSYDPDHFYLAVYRNPGELRNLNDKATSIAVNFDCKPQRFLKTGETPISILQENLNQWIEINNPTEYVSFPKIVVEGQSVTIEFSLDKVTNTFGVDVLFTEKGTIDSDLQECYASDKYLNNEVTLSNGFPKLYPGKNYIRVTAGSLVSFTITPRWWRI